jgi:DNA-binding IclR family transcriptional regulator
MGKAILAFADTDLRATLGGVESLPRFTSSTITRRPAFVAELEHIRKEGYAMNLEERYAGVSGVAAPILDDRGRSRAAIGIRGPAVRLDARRIRELAPFVQAAAGRVAAYLSLERL